MSNPVRWISNSDKKWKCTDELKGLFSHALRSSASAILEIQISNKLVISYHVIPKNHQHIQVFIETALVWTNKTLMWVRRYLSRGYDVVKFIWSRKQGNQKQNKTQPPYLCFSNYFRQRYFSFRFLRYSQRILIGFLPMSSFKVNL